MRDDHLGAGDTYSSSEHPYDSVEVDGFMVTCALRLDRYASAACATARPSTASCGCWPPFAGYAVRRAGRCPLSGRDELLDERGELTGS
jgi:hypothetical protein